ncbi:MAG: hypothetical protein ACXADL_14635 [Candidatus Thorarchaeota archaeon]|jgi:hypothetical protein
MSEFCYIHPNTSASGFCAKCGKPVCTECVDAFAGTTKCPQCRGIVSRPSSVQKTEASGPWAEDMYIGVSNVRTQLLVGFIGTLILIVGSIASLIAAWLSTPFGPVPFSFMNTISFLVGNIAAMVGSLLLLIGLNALRVRYEEVLFLVTIVLGLLYYGSLGMVLFMPFTPLAMSTLILSFLAGLLYPIALGGSFFRIKDRSFKPSVVGFYGIMEVLAYFGGYMLIFLFFVLGELAFLLPSIFALIISFIRPYVFYGEWKRKEEPHWISEEKPTW